MSKSLLNAASQDVKKVGNWTLTTSPMRFWSGVSDNKVYGASMVSTWVLSAPGGPHVGPTNFAVWGDNLTSQKDCPHYWPFVEGIYQ